MRAIAVAHADIGADVASPSRPRPRVVRVADVAGGPGDAQRGERVEHHGHLAGAVLRLAALAAARLRTVDEPGGVQADRTDPDARPGPAHEVTVGVEEHLVGVDVGVVVRHLHGVGTEVVQPGHERADDEAVPGEGLVHRRRLVEGADDRCEVVDAQRPRVDVAVPADDVEGMLAVHVAGEPGARAHEHLDVLAVDQQRPLGSAQVTLGVRRAVGELPGRGEVLAGDVHMAA